MPPADEAARLVPAIEGLVEPRRVPVMADTFTPEVARRALDAGAAAINDIGGGADPAMLDLVAEAGCGYVLMHIDGPPREQRRPRSYDDPIAHLKGWFTQRLDAARRRGVAEEQIALDPGFDFDLTVDDDVEILPGSTSCAISAGRCSSRCPARTSWAPSWPGRGRPVRPPRAASGRRSRR